MKKSWLEPYLTAVLTGRRHILDSWRRQVPALSGRTKNFENWLLVELVDRVSRSAKIRDLRTNGHFSDKKIKASEVDGLSGSKSKAVHLSPDISVRLKTGDRIVSSEIKTGLAPKEIFNDLKIVKHYNKETRVCNQAEFAWVVLLPDGETERRSSAKSFEKIYLRMQEDNPDFLFVRREITPWLVSVVAVPE
jgi:hypothetical protein